MEENCLTTNYFIYTWSQKRANITDEDIVSLSTELSIKIIQIQSPDKGSSKSVVFQVTDLN